MDYKKIQNEMEKTYDGIYDKYIDEAKHDWEDKKYVDKFLNYLSKDASILDVGCGTGELLEYYDKLGFKITGIDISQNMVDFSKQRVKNANILKMSIYDIDKIDVKYDAISATFVFVHIPKAQMQNVLKSIKDRLKPGGIFFTVYTTSLKEGFQDEPLDNNYKFYSVNHCKNEFENIFNQNRMKILDFYKENRIDKLPIEIIIAQKYN